jgi:hypothetical protein
MWDCFEEIDSVFERRIQESDVRRQKGKKIIAVDEDRRRLCPFFFCILTPDS